MNKITNEVEASQKKKTSGKKVKPPNENHERNSHWNIRPMLWKERESAFHTWNLDSSIPLEYSLFSAYFNYHKLIVT